MTTTQSTGSSVPAQKAPPGDKADADKSILDSIGEAISSPMREAAEEDDRERMLEQVPPKKTQPG